MPAQSSPSFSFDPDLAGKLACPACLGDLRPEDVHLACAGCARNYPIVDGIPVLIAERAEAGEAPD
jgi:hypothetical protein